MSKSKMSQKALLLNGAAILVAGASFSLVIRSVFIGEQVPPCRERMGHAIRLSLDKSGVPLTGAELQARFGATEWNLLDGGRVVKLKSGPAQQALELDLSTAPSATARETTADGDEKKPGLGFVWTPQTFGTQPTACLSYSVFLPENFTFGKSGRLPGLIGTSQANAGAELPQPLSEDGSAAPEPQQAKADPNAFSTRLTWNINGDVNVLASLAGGRETRSLIESHFASLPRGRWIDIEQEARLNTPGEFDGIARLWIDGKLVLNKTDAIWTDRPGAGFNGVLAEATAGDLPTTTKRLAQKIWISPFDLRWP
ncbi:MAG: hypothetical protein JSS20_01775 [Proteobacteria bacterium]|nr:hypothetical protein [Pseudomonadota bacterium]